ncbi:MULTISPECIES: DNA polymerase Y family protein [unclassified Acidovorax]|uniref:DNA polymerase Y family protein n=1 Tax=unclassified Acidovorax TaxID=2684926 RepID=UPI002882FD8E|nr:MULTISPECIES: DNA polymerase Y family protein [unclassified Acidovorax]
MHWIALPLPAPDPQPGGVPVQAHGWWALRFTPRVALLEEALLIEVGSVARLWGGVPALLQLLQRHRPLPLPAADGQGCSAALQPPDESGPAQAPTALQALAQLRLLQTSRPLPRRLPYDLPLRTLTDLRPHAAELEHMGCRTWGAVRALPRAGLARRLGAGPLLALDRAWGDVQHLPPWLQAPESFAMEAELPALAESADALLWSASRLLGALQSWLQARHQGALALSLGWRHDLRRIDGVDLPAWQSLEVRTAQPVQEMTHLRRLLAERLGRQQLAAPVNRIALKALQTAPWTGDSISLLPPGPHDMPGEPWHQLLERLSARLGAGRVQGLRLVADHRPEGMQEWQALEGSAAGGGLCAATVLPADARAVLWPRWLVQPPRALALQGSRPCLQGPLRLLVGPQRFETAWWEAGSQEQNAPAAEMPVMPGEAAAGPARRDYFVAHNATVGHVWIFRDLQGRWFLHGIYG